MEGCDKEGNPERQVFIACFSKEYNERERTYMGEELTIAIEELRVRPSETTWFIPILLNNTTIPSRRISNVEDLSDVNAVNLYEDWGGGIDRILRVLSYDNPQLARVWYLMDIVDRPFDNERLHAIHQLGTIGVLAKPAVFALSKASKENNFEIKKTAIEALGNIGPAAVDAVPALTAALEDPEVTIRWIAAGALGKIGPIAVDAVPAVAVALKDPDPDVRRIAGDALGKIGPSAAEAVPTRRRIGKDRAGRRSSPRRRPQ